MPANQLKLKAMLESVARALGDELLSRMAFVGGSTTALLLTDTVTLESIRFTEDVDLIVGADSMGAWLQLKKQLRARGFTESMDDDIVCRMRLGDLKVDFLPQDEKILGFTNRWYADALKSAHSYRLTDELTINLLDPVYFFATKLEAWRGRGNNDPLISHDLEDIIHLVDGREELLPELNQARPDVRGYIAQQVAKLLEHPGFEYAVQGTIADSQRADMVMTRFEAIANQ